MSYDVVPLSLKQIPQWVSWTYEGQRKVPYNPRSGKRASSTNAQTWADFDTALSAAARQGHAGIGYVFTADDPYTGIDLDDCVEGETIATWAMDIVKTMNSYSEISPSQTGIKIWVEGKIPQNIKTEHIEIYSQARYFTVTGQHIAGTPTTIRYVNGDLDKLAETIRTPELQQDAAEPRARATVPDDYLHQWADRVIESALARIRAAPLGSKHNTLLAMSRLLGGLIPLGLATDTDLAAWLEQTTDAHAEHPQTARTTIRDGLAMGMKKPLEPPEPPPQPVFDVAHYACCPVHQTRLDQAKNGNGYKCHRKDDTTASGWCDFWWQGEGYLPPPEPVTIAGELITQAQVVREAARYQLYKLSGLRALPPVEWLIEGEIPKALTTIICGPSGAGKSFLMVDYAIRVARRYPDQVVVYIAPEGGSGYHMRTEAWLDHFGGDEPDNLVFILQAIPMLTPQAVSDLIATIQPFKPVMLIIDTLARCLVGGDENSAKDVGMFFYYTDMIRQETGAAIAIVHHTGKSGGGYRGSSVLYGSVESWIDVVNDDGLITVSCGKSKDAKPFPPRYLRMVESVDSVVLLPADQVDQRGAPLSEGQRNILEALALDIFREAGARRSEIVSASGINDRTIFRILSRMKRDGLINQSKKGDPYFISDQGLVAIKAYHRELRLKRDVDKVANEASDPNAQVANSQTTRNQLSESSPDQLASSTNLHPYKGGASSLRDQDASSDSSEDLFSDDDHTPTEPVADIPQQAPAAAPEGAGGLDWGYLRKMYAAGNVAAIRVHCGVNRADPEGVLEQLFAEQGAADASSD